MVRFDTSSISQSIFERLINSGRVSSTFLASQWRMHPSISRITSVPFYKCLFHNPAPVGNFVTNYNQPHVNPRQFNPMTFVDTSTLRDHYEDDAGDGEIRNEIEAAVVSDLLQRLYSLCGDDGLDDQIAIICAYRAQVQQIRLDIDRNVPALLNHHSRLQRNVLVCTVDSMQGSQRGIIIFSATRSNSLHATGFVKDRRRLNVSVTRAQFLNIVVGDSITIKAQKEGYGIPGLADIYRRCSRGEHGSCVMNCLLYTSPSPRDA